MSSLIKLENISKTYVMGDHTVHALRTINLDIQQGEMTSIVGASGSGKSTLMNIIGFLDRPSTGQYIFNQTDVSDLDEDELANIRNQQVGFVFQSFFLLPRLTALQNVVLPLFYRGTPTDEAENSAMQLLDKMGVAALATHRPNQLSGGQQQRVAIARALVGDPKIILADEPTGALDSDTGEEVMRLLSDLHRNENRTIVIITHDKAISRRSERIITIKDGTIVKE